MNRKGIPLDKTTRHDLLGPFPHSLESTSKIKAAQIDPPLARAHLLTCCPAPQVASHKELGRESIAAKTMHAVCCMRAVH